MKFPQNLHAEKGERHTLRIGEHDLSDLPISTDGPIVVCHTPGDPHPVFTAWVPILFEGTVTDPNSLVRIVHEGQAESVGLPTPKED